MLLCQRNQAWAVQYGKYFQDCNFTFKRTHPRNPHHFMFSAQIDQETIEHLKTVDHTFIKFHLASEKKPFILDQGNHCAECKHHLKT